MLGPAGVMVEMAGHERDIDVAAFADRLAVIHGLEHGEEAAVLLDQAGDGIEIFAALIARQRTPGREGGASGLDRCIDILGGAIGDVGELLAIGWVVGGEGLARLGPGAINEMAELLAMRIEPGERHIGALGRRTVVEGFEDLGDFVHGAVLAQTIGMR